MTHNPRTCAVQLTVRTANTTRCLPADGQTDRGRAVPPGQPLARPSNSICRAGTVAGAGLECESDISPLVDLRGMALPGGRVVLLLVFIDMLGVGIAMPLVSPLIKQLGNFDFFSRGHQPRCRLKASSRAAFQVPPPLRWVSCPPCTVPYSSFPAPSWDCSATATGASWSF